MHSGETVVAWSQATVDIGAGIGAVRRRWRGKYTLQTFLGQVGQSLVTWVSEKESDSKPGRLGAALRPTSPLRHWGE